MVRYFVPTDSMPGFIYMISVTEKPIIAGLQKSIPQTMQISKRPRLASPLKNLKTQKVIRFLDRAEPVTTQPINNIPHVYAAFLPNLFTRLHKRPRVYGHLGCQTISLFPFKGLLICDKSKYERSKYISSHVYGTGYRLLIFLITRQLKLIVKVSSAKLK